MRAGGYDALIVDDEGVVVAAARRILGAEGLQADVAVDARTALERVRAHEHGVVLCDLKMPGVRGHELVREILAVRPETPVVTITGYATLENAVEGFASGIFDFIPKPFDVGELLGVVYRALGYARNGSTAPAPAADAANVYLLGGHAWVALDARGRARIGMGRTFGPLTEPLSVVELPAAGDELLQGNRCVRLVTASEQVHRLWAPLSGQVVEVDERALGCAAREPGAICRSGLITVLPSNPQVELSRLARLTASGAERG